MNLNRKQQLLFLIFGIIASLSLLTGVYSIGYYLGLVVVAVSFFLFLDNHSEKLQIPWKRLIFISLSLITVGIVGVMVLDFFQSESTGRTNYYSSDITPVPTTDYLSFISTDNVRAERDNFSLYLRGSIKNNNVINDLCVSLRVDFTKDKEGQQIFDTRVLSRLVPAGGAKQLNLLISNFEYKGQFWTIATVKTTKSEEPFCSVESSVL